MTILCIIEVRFFVSSVVLKNPPERKAENRYAQCRGTESVLRTLALLLATHSRAKPKQAKEPNSEKKYLYIWVQRMT
jgi:hypothetical protein